MEKEEIQLLLWVEGHGEQKEVKEAENLDRVMVEVTTHLQRDKQPEVLMVIRLVEVVEKEVVVEEELVK